MTQRQWGWKMWTGTLLGIAALTGGIVGFSLWDADRTSKRLTVEAEAIGFTATPTKWWDSGEEENVEGHTLTYAYVGPGNRVYTRQVEQVEWYRDVNRYKVCYNPEDGDDSKLYTVQHVCGQ